MKKDRFIIGLTGGPGSGKTAAASLFRKYGAVMIDADRIARCVLDKGSPCFKTVIRRFGKEILLPGGKINRQKMRGIIFFDIKRRKTLERIVHPAIIREIRRRLRTVKNRLIVIDAPLLFETGIEHLADTVVVVQAARERCIRRLMRRDRISRKSAVAIIRSQMSAPEKARRADHIINNDGTIRELRKKIDLLIRSFKWNR